MEGTLAKRRTAVGIVLLAGLAVLQAGRSFSPDGHAGSDSILSLPGKAASSPPVEQWTDRFTAALQKVS